MHFFTKTKRLSAAIIVSAFTISASFSAYATLGTPLYDTTLALSDNSQFNTSAAYHQTNGLENAFILEYQPGGAVVPIVAYGSKLYGRSDINGVTSYIKSSGKTVVGGINGDFFELSSGIPIGLVVTDGILRSSDAWQSAVGFLSDGSAFIGNPQLSMSVSYPYSGLSIPIMYINKERTNAGVYLLTDDFSSQTHITTKGINVVLKKLEDKPLKIGDTIQLSVVSVTETSASTPINPGEMVLTVDSTGPKQSVDLLRAIKPGDALKLGIEPTQDARWKDIVYGVGGGNILVQDGQVSTNLKTDFNPHTALGIRADGTVLLFAVDGRQTGYSAGLSLSDLASQMLDLGCVSAVNFDGGGSTTTGVVYPGDASLTVANSPSDGSLRKCANFLMLVNTLTPTKTPAKLYIYPYDIAALAGASTPLQVKAVDSSYYPTTVPDDLGYSVSGDAGRIENGLYYSSDQAASGEISAYASGGISGLAKVQVYDKVDVLSLHKSDQSDILSSLSMKPGEQIDLDVTAYLNRRILISDDSLFTFSATGGIGTIDTEGKFTATNTLGAAGTITASYKNGVKVDIPVTVGQTPELIDNFDSAVSRWTLDPAVPATYGSVLTTRDYSYVKYGTGAAALNYNFAAGTKVSSIKFVPSAGAVALEGNPNYLNLWVYGDSSGNSISLETKDSAGNIQPSSTSYVLDFAGYRQLSFPLPKGAAKLSGVILTTAAGSKPSGTLYFDQMIASFDVAFSDIAAPTVAITSFPGSGDNTSQITATVSDTGGLSLKSLAITLALDGVNTAFTFDDTTGAISAALEDLSPGMHRVTLKATDISGNFSRTSIAFVFGDLPETSFADMKNHWSAPYVDFLSRKNVITGELKKDKYYYSPERNTTRLETAVLIAKYIGFDLTICADVTLPFADLSQIPSWALPYVKAMYKAGLMLGKTTNGKTYFAPNANITRMEAMTILGRTLPQGCTPIDTSFKDASKIASWAKPYIENLTSLGIIAGYPDGTILPTNNIKRSEIASMLFKLY